MSLKRGVSAPVAPLRYFLVMKATRIIALLVAVPIVLLIASCQALRYYDHKARTDALGLVSQQLSAGASLSDVQAFLERFFFLLSIGV